MQLVGLKLGRYHLLKRIGEGGMGEVYLAEDPGIRQVALKVISPDPGVAQESARRFREAKAIARFNHPHILPIYDHGEGVVEGKTLLYIVMPYYQGGSLRDWLRQSRTNSLLSPEEIAPLLLQAADAIQHAHDAGIIHRDIKPDNFLLRSRQDTTVPDLLLADFGIAAIMDVSTSGLIRGTAAYMPPEQWKGQSVPATDQYALAIMVYEMLTGYPPFQGNRDQVMYKHFSETPQPPSTLNPRVSQDIDAVILKALEKEPEDRFSSVLDFAQAFQSALQDDDASSAATMPIERDGLNNFLKPPTLIKLSVLFAATLGLILLLIGPFLAIPAIPYVGLVLAVIGWGLGLLQSAWFRRWNWFVFILILSPLAGIIYGLIGPTRKPQSAVISPLVKVFRDKTSKTRQYVASAIGAVLLIEAIGVGNYINYASNTALYNGVAPGKESMYAILTRGNPTQDYPLINNIGNNKWEERQGCTFTAGAYHVSSNSQQDINPCFLQGIFLSNFVFQVQMTIIAGGTGGILFRDSGGNGKGLYYYLSFSSDGSYYLSFYVDANNFHSLTYGTASAFKAGLGQANTVALAANGSTIDLYVNQQYFDSVSDSSSAQGSIAIVAEGSPEGSAEVVYSDAKVWTL